MRRYLILLLLACMALLSFIAVHVLAGELGSLKIYFLDVGQGDAEFIQLPGGGQVLIDGGPDAGIVRRLGEIMPFFDRTIDLVILTHAHADHVTGLAEVLKRYEVEKILENQVRYETPEYARWNELKTEAEVIQVRAGYRIDLGGGAVMTILFPYKFSSDSERIKNPHDYNIVAKLTYGRGSVLFTGDIEAKGEQTMVDGGADLDSDFLKIGHHGSKTSSTEKFLQAVSPKAAFIEVGAKNNYGHPHPTVLRRLESLAIKYYRTDVDGSKELILDGENFVVK